jgi:hypothetical protein
MNQSIDLSQYDTLEEGVEAAKQFLLEHGFTIIQHSPRYFDFMLDNKFGHFTVDSYGAYSLSSVYRPSSTNGTGCQVKDHFWEFSVGDAKSALNNTQHCETGSTVAFYGSLEQRIRDHWAKGLIVVHYPELRVPPDLDEKEIEAAMPWTE